MFLVTPRLDSQSHSEPAVSNITASGDQNHAALGSQSFSTAYGRFQTFTASQFLYRLKIERLAEVYVATIL
jgi:hypothetical protein